MPIKGARLRWPPRPGKRLGDRALSGPRHSLSTGAANAAQPLQQPSRRNDSADQGPSHTRESMHQAQDDDASRPQEPDFDA